MLACLKLSMPRFPLEGLCYWTLPLAICENMFPEHAPTLGRAFLVDLCEFDGKMSAPQCYFNFEQSKGAFH